MKHDKGTKKPGGRGCLTLVIVGAALMGLYILAQTEVLPAPLNTMAGGAVFVAAEAWEMIKQAMTIVLGLLIFRWYTNDKRGKT